MKKVFTRKDDIFRTDISFYLTHKIGESPMCIGEPVQMKERKIEECGQIETFPTFTLDIKEAQFLMDGLWDCGLRPSEGTGSAGAMAATQKHLEDMRSLIFKHHFKE